MKKKSPVGTYKCPNCGCKLKRDGGRLKCRCGYSRVEPEDNTTKHFIFGTRYW